MDRNAADAAWDSISMTFKRKLMRSDRLSFYKILKNLMICSSYTEGWVQIKPDKVKEMQEDESIDFTDGVGYIMVWIYSINYIASTICGRRR
jgi:hypothetical protein